MEIIKIKGYNNLYAVDSFFIEYSELFGKSKAGIEKYKKKLMMNLHILDQKRRGALQFQQFEKLENAELFSIRHVSKVNPRVIFAYMDEYGRSVLLCSFKEKKGRDYGQALELARKRMKEIGGRI